MAGRIRGVREAKASMDRLIKDITGRKAVRGIQSALIILGAASAKEVPRDTSTLINSQFREIDFNGTLITGRVGYSANYAIYVHEAPGKYLNTQTDRPVRAGEAPGSRGVIWGPGGNPKFLYWPAVDNQSEMYGAFKKEMEL
ncbi:HK97 gp10 family phage protein [Klebsiella pneumoniae]|uniref:HK97 gp10 family phage protein n=1 Tax=Klebsiella pneumoniae complex TaxID=3390273 RepID=UPI000E34A700|nr:MULTISPECIES: HK97 gp10 family phage protein [Klebsiella]EMB5598953.1 HK97 gp10 family phage protein [Klebsiella pneumoniae]MBM1100756.1 HK97 gp10 family phage protein [Klebsiella pneumoniae]MBQ5085932.1 HK97 gp10 family phage protein [Klebsiella pneumoniae]MBR7250370.1 HK97 gp10 family phage protein [Klebsiella pneumoniae]QKK55146.1 HK97 gp10 family phage protein [Klebsiella variicola]